MDYSSYEHWEGPTSRGSSMPFLVTMICFGCSSTGRERIRAATSSAVFHLASCRDKTGQTGTENFSVPDIHLLSHNES